MTKKKMNYNNHNGNNNSNNQQKIWLNSKSCEFIASKFIMLNINFGKYMTGNDLESDLFIFFFAPTHISFHFERHRLVIMSSRVAIH